jgi:hypothetical protein
VEIADAVEAGINRSIETVQVIRSTAVVLPAEVDPVGCCRGLRHARWFVADVEAVIVLCQRR